VQLGGGRVDPVEKQAPFRFVGEDGDVVSNSGRGGNYLRRLA